MGNLRNDLTGKRFGMLLVLRRSDKVTKNGTIVYTCLCDCGKIKDIRGIHLTNGNTVSCTCKGKNKKHGMSKSNLYTAWKNIKARVYNENHKAFKNYGGRGISMCQEWRISFESFRDWSLQNGYSDSLTIDRIDNEGDYTPDNCRWTDVKTQANNNRANVRVEIDGEIFSFSQLSEKYSVKESTLRQRYAKGERGSVLTRPTDKSKSRTKTVIVK